MVLYYHTVCIEPCVYFYKIRGEDFEKNTCLIVVRCYDIFFVGMYCKTGGGRK